MTDRNPMTATLPAARDFPDGPAAIPFHPESARVSPATAGLVRESISPNTRRAYRGALERLDAWLGGRVLDDHALAEWITGLHHRGLSAASASLAVAAARFGARMAGMENPAGPMTARTLAGIRRSSAGRGRGQVAGIPWEEADRAVDNAMGEGTVRGMRDAALIAVGSDALLRVGEMAAIDVRDIGRDPDGSAVLHIHRSKTDQEGHLLSRAPDGGGPGQMDGNGRDRAGWKRPRRSGVPLSPQGRRRGRPAVLPLRPFHRDCPLR